MDLKDHQTLTPLLLSCTLEQYFKIFNVIFEKRKNNLKVENAKMKETKRISDIEPMAALVAASKNNVEVFKVNRNYLL